MAIIYHMINFCSQASRHYLNFQVSFLTGILLYCLPLISHAAERTEKILINADHMQLNIESGYSVYTGNVKISQGELVLTGDKVTLKQNNNNEVEQITVDGKPARYNHRTENGDPIEAESEHMVYNASKNKLIMTINAKLHQPDQHLSSQKIVYDTLKKIIIAGGDSKPASRSSKTDAGPDADTSKKQRVNITLTPKKQSPPDESAAE